MGAHPLYGALSQRGLLDPINPVHTHPFNGPFSGTTQVSRYQKGKIDLEFTEARDSEWQWHQLEHMQVCTSLQTDNHANTPPLSFLQAGCPSCRPTNSVKALKALIQYTTKNRLDGQLKLTANAFNQLWISMSAVLITVPSVMQNLAASFTNLLDTESGVL